MQFASSLIVGWLKRGISEAVVSNVKPYGQHIINSRTASNPGCRSLSDGLFDRHVGWKSSAAKFGHIKNQASDFALSVSP